MEGSEIRSKATSRRQLGVKSQELFLVEGLPIPGVSDEAVCCEQTEAARLTCYFSALA